MTSFLTREGPWHSDILFWTCDRCFHLLFLSHHCLKGRNGFSHFSDGETETQKCQEDAVIYPRGWLSPTGLFNNPGPWIPNPLSTIYPCGGQKESRFPNSPTGKMYLGSSLWAQFPHLCPPWRGWQRALRGWSNLVLSFGLQFEQQDKEMPRGGCSGIIPVASRGPVLSVCLSCLSHNPYCAFPHCLLSPPHPPLCPHPAVDWL